MSNRIALMVRGLPSIGIDEVVERFGKYYKSPVEGVFHSSESFPKGYSSPSGTITFVDKQNSFQGGGGLTREAMRDLRQLRSDFEKFTLENPSIYNANPTTKSRAKLYSRAVGAINVGGNWKNQLIDARRIAKQDLPYVQALDVSILPTDTAKVLSPNILEAFLKDKDRIIAASRVGSTLGRVLQGNSSEYLSNAIESQFIKKRFLRSKEMKEGMSWRDYLQMQEGY